MCSDCAISSPWLTAKEAGEYARMSPKTIDSERRKGNLKAHPALGSKRRRWLYRLEDLDDFLMRR